MLTTIKNINQVTFNLKRKPRLLSTIKYLEIVAQQLPY